MEGEGWTAGGVSQLVLGGWRQHHGRRGQVLEDMLASRQTPGGFRRGEVLVCRAGQGRGTGGGGPAGGALGEPHPTRRGQFAARAADASEAAGALRRRLSIAR